MEQVIVGLFTEVRRHKPSVIYIPNIDAWYATLTGTVALITFQTMLKSIQPTDPVLLLATAECEKGGLPGELVRDFFGYARKNKMEIGRPERVCVPRNRFGTRGNADLNSRIEWNTSPRPLNTSRRSQQSFQIRRTARRESWRNFQLLLRFKASRPPRQK